MERTMDATRPRAYDPEGRTGEPVPPTPGWDTGPDRRIDDAGTLATVLTWVAVGAGVAAVGVIGWRLLFGGRS